MRRRDGELVVALAKSRQGKTTWVRSQVMKLPRVLVWDVKGEWAANYPEFIALRSWRALQSAVANATGFTAQRARLAFVPPSVDRESFERFALVAHGWGLASPCTVVAEELPDVTGIGKARSHWGRLLRQGLGAGIDIYALSTSPAESDKTTLNNATRLFVGALGTERNRKYAAGLLDVDAGEVATLEQLEFLLRDGDGVVKRGRLAFSPAGVAYVKGRPKVITRARAPA